MMPYTLIRSRRRTISIRITHGGEVEVRCPTGMAAKEIDAILEAKSPWIQAQLEKARTHRDTPKLTPEELQSLAAQAAQDLPQRSARFAGMMGVTYGRITIRAQHSRWGSCSGKGNLNFNCLLMLCPEEVRDYVVVHELCHRREMNHSKQFWALVEDVLPGYRSPRAWLKDQGSALICRLP